MPNSVAVGEFNGESHPDLAVANSGSNNVSVLLNGSNHAPVATGDSYTTDEDTPLNVGAASGVLSNDTDSDGDTLSTAVVSRPTKDTLSLNANGSFTYKASDGKLDSDVATVTITVNPSNDNPVAKADSYRLKEDTKLYVPPSSGVLKNDSDVDADSRLSATTLSKPKHGTLRANGSFTYRPDKDYTGRDRFTYSLSDGQGGKDTAKVILRVPPLLRRDADAPSLAQEKMMSSLALLDAT